MEPEITELAKEQEASFASLKKVTPLSKYLAMILFIIMPFLGGWIGYTYAPDKVVEVESLETFKEVGVVEMHARDTVRNSCLFDLSTVIASVDTSGWEIAREERIFYKYPTSWVPDNSSYEDYGNNLTFDVGSGGRNILIISTSTIQSLPSVGHFTPFYLGDKQWWMSQVKGSGLDNFLYWIFYTKIVDNPEEVILVSFYTDKTDVDVYVDYTWEYISELTQILQVISTIDESDKIKARESFMDDWNKM